jgi:hypothetical protein
MRARSVCSDGGKCDLITLSSNLVTGMGLRVHLLLVDLEGYTNKLLPAIRSFRDSLDPAPIRIIVDEAKRVADMAQPDGRFLGESSEVYEGEAAILEGKAFYNRRGSVPDYPDQQTSKEDKLFLLEQCIAPSLFADLCLASSESPRPWQGMSDPELMNLLYENSDWIQDYFTFAKSVCGQSLEVTIGEWSQLLSASEVAEFVQELDRIPEPSNPQVSKELKNLRTIATAASSNPSYGLLMCLL